MTGAFIVLEGGDGVGKSTQAAALVEWLTARGTPHVHTRQPGGTPLGASLRSLVLDPATGDVAPRAEALIYAADKAQHLMQVVEPALAEGLVVVCDRYVDSMIAYQGAGRALDVAEVEQVADWATAGRRPELTILLDAAPGDAVAQIAEKDRLEGAGDEFHRRVRAHFLHLAEAAPERYLVVDARLPITEVTSAITARVEQLLDGD
ncbi:dTMP kinase [Tessaracoccus rhinocerotis]|uniref:Thymidylate kinase n=1 Tax=Tessaracoccus rhinocerotis TaxID=1689449 RepID=A0A553K1G3_9ACTN|nr:dTMP kinase [Tessaracoccus rhinocerotis]TRY18541.1 dTMP kinase [Tessaracoccus rhinocerotis]